MGMGKIGKLSCYAAKSFFSSGSIEDLKSAQVKTAKEVFNRLDKKIKNQ